MEDHWECKVNFGTEVNFAEQAFDERFLSHKKIHTLTALDNSAFYVKKYILLKFILF